MNTAWIAIDAIYPAYWMVDLGANDSIDTVRLAYLSGYNYSLNITVSLDNITFSQVYTNSSYYVGTNTVFLPNITFSSTNARYIKIWLINNPSNPASFPELTEVQIYGEPTPIIYTPINQSNQTKMYPPLTMDVNFTWSIGTPLMSNLRIAKDSNFNLIAVDTVTSNNNSVQSLEAGNYWWKVRYYNSTSGTYGNYSDTFNFTLTNNVSATGTGVQGVVYESLNGVQTPISGATVYIQHSSNNWSSQMTVGSNGYYLFSNLSNNTVYYIYATKKDYQNSVTEYVTTGTGTIVTRDIFMKPTEPTWFEADKHYVRIGVRYLFCLWNCDIEGVTLNVYKYGDVTTTFTGITDSTGSKSFLLFKTQQYRIVAVNSSAGINQEMTIYPTDTEYLFLITNAETPWQEYPVQEKDAITIGVSKLVINGTTANIIVNFTDSLSGTTALKYYINQTNTSDPANETQIQSWIWAAGSYNHTFTVSNFSGQSYFVHVVATHGVFGTIDRTFAVPFEKVAGVGITGISNTLWMWFAISIMFFTGAMFTSSTVEKGLLIVCAEGWIFFLMGLFASLGSTQFAIGLTMASVIAVFAYLRRSQASEGYA